MKHLATVVFFLSASPLFAQDELVGLRVREWYARMSGTLEGMDPTLGSTRLDLADDLGLGHQNWTTELQAYLRVPVVGRFYVGWWRVNDSGNDTLTRDITFAGETFTATTPIHSEITLDVAYLNYEFAFPTISLGDTISLGIGVSVGARGFRGEGTIDDGSNPGNKSGAIGLPTVGAHATVELFKFLRAEAEVLGLSASYGENKANYLEAYGEIVAEPLPWLFAGVGYKFAAINFDHGGNDAFKVDVDVAGFYLTVGVRF